MKSNNSRNGAQRNDESLHLRLGRRQAMQWFRLRLWKCPSLPQQKRIDIIGGNHAVVDGTEPTGHDNADTACMLNCPQEKSMVVLMVLW